MNFKDNFEDFDIKNLVSFSFIGYNVVTNCSDDHGWEGCSNCVNDEVEFV